MAFIVSVGGVLFIKIFFIFLQFPFSLDGIVWRILENCWIVELFLVIVVLNCECTGRRRSEIGWYKMQFSLIHEGNNFKAGCNRFFTIWLNWQFYSLRLDLCALVTCFIPFTAPWSFFSSFLVFFGLLFGFSRTLLWTI